MMLRVVSHDRPIALANTSSDSACVSRIFCSMTAVGTFDMSESGIADWLRRGGRVDLARNFTDDRVDF